MSDERQECCGFARWGNEGEECVYGREEGLRNSILLPTLTYGSEHWTWNGAQQWRVCAVEMSYLRGACRVSRWDGLNNESVYERCGMRGRGSGVECGVVERSTLRWFGHIERMGNEEFVKKVYILLFILLFIYFIFCPGLRLAGYAFLFICFFIFLLTGIIGPIFSFLFVFLLGCLVQKVHMKIS